jgi:hypothetical protein
MRAVKLPTGAPSERRTFPADFRVPDSPQHCRAYPAAVPAMRVQTNCLPTLRAVELLAHGRTGSVGRRGGGAAGRRERAAGSCCAAAEHLKCDFICHHVRQGGRWRESAPCLARHRQGWTSLAGARRPG